MGLGAFGGGLGGMGGGMGGGYGGMGGGMEAPKPFAMGYQANGDGAASFRSEQGDASGNVRGSYGYRDAQGLYRMVEYSAGQGGIPGRCQDQRTWCGRKGEPS
ncbi:hypothetical protein CEXT_76231 [Caerostris extrusa]|uniref:Uncharacterized protein n=1 Tax=Caerostris extrusa TaxID=172846 RepID=A0AAV4Q676_CAEEX|nr:hypothetical protein CEXT_76231 [Caerostris extrusa]